MQSEVSDGGLSEGKKDSSGKQDSRKPSFKMIMIAVVVGAIALFFWTDQQRRNTSEQLDRTMAELEELRATTVNSSDDVASEIIEKVRGLVDIPLDPRPTVAEINDIDRLKEANEFFGVAKNGDYLILTGNRALIYDPDRDIVLDVAPFSVGSESPSPSPAAPILALAALAPHYPYRWIIHRLSVIMLP